MGSCCVPSALPWSPNIQPERCVLAFHLLRATWELPLWPEYRFLCTPADGVLVSPVCNSGNPSVAHVTLPKLNLNGNWMNCLEVIQPSRTINPYYWQALAESFHFEWEWRGKPVVFLVFHTTENKIASRSEKSLFAALGTRDLMTNMASKSFFYTYSIWCSSNTLLKWKYFTKLSRISRSSLGPKRRKRVEMAAGREWWFNKEYNLH